MPKEENTRHDNADSNADQEKPPVSGKRNKNNQHHGDGNK